VHLALVLLGAFCGEGVGAASGEAALRSLAPRIGFMASSAMPYFASIDRRRL
jgi:hypothetical protein